jgi:leucine-zipper of insertion element IS481
LTKATVLTDRFDRALLYVTHVHGGQVRKGLASCELSGGCPFGRTGNADVGKPQRFAEDRMDTHKNARLTPKGREEMVRAVADRGISKAAAARQLNTTPKTVGKWVDRFCAEGVDGLRD